MTATRQPDRGRDRPTELVQEEIARLRDPDRDEARIGVTAAADSAFSNDVDRFSLPRLGESVLRLESRATYRLEDFLQYHDEDFVRNAYHGLLRREPDVAGFTDFLDALRSARLSKTEILGRIRYSPEGRATSVAVRGLLLPFALRSVRRVPVLGHLVGIVQYLVRLPNIVRNHERLEAAMFQRDLELRRHLDATQDVLEQQVTGLRECVADHKAGQAQLEGLSDIVESGLGELIARVQLLAGRKADDERVTRLAEQIFDAIERKAGQAQLERLSDIVASGLSELAARVQLLADGKADDERVTRLADQLFDAVERKAGQARVEALSERVEANLNGLSSRVQAVADGTLDKADLPDAMYVAFEDRFRGTREDIMQRVAVYLPVVRACQAGTANAPVLDIGCGRGEWLEVLTDAGLVTRGVDRNPVMVAECRARGLDVVQGDGIGYLRQLPSGSLGVLSAIHVIEHIGFNDLIALLDEARRVLRPGGMLVLETPNPENLIVGACSFYYDPTHRQPLPPEPMRHVTQARGFTDVEILRLHPATPPEKTTANPDAWTARIDALLYGPQDYAIIARKGA